MASDSYYFRRVLVAAAAAALPFLALTVYGLLAQRQEDREAAIRQIHARAEAAANSVESELRRAERVLSFLSELPALRAGDPTACAAAMRNVATVDPLLVNVGAIDRAGLPLCRAFGGPAPPTNYLSQPWTEAALAADGLRFSAPMIGVVSGRWVSALSLPLRNPRGDKIGVAAASIDLQGLADRHLSTTGLPDGSVLTLVNSEGLILASSEALAQWVGQRAAPVVIDRLLAVGGPAFEASGLDGVNRVITSALLDRYGLRIGAGVPTDAVYAASNRRFQASAGAVLAILLLALGVAVYSARALSRPIIHLSATARAVATGNVLARADESLPGELGTLAVEFNRAVTAHLAGNVAQHAQTVAESASEAKSRFLANMSHEIRTPLNAVIGYAELMLRGPLQPRQREYVTRQRLAARSLLRLIGDILDFSKIEAGRLELEAVVFRLDEVLDRALAMVAGTAHDKGIELVVAVDADVPVAVVGDPLRLQQVLVNLCGNAVKFTEAGEVEVSVGRVPGAEPGCVALRFSVRDTGTGLTPDAEAHLFHAFSQGDASTTRRHGGTGLGLAISRALVTLMNGDIEFHSAPGQGTTFSFTVKLQPCTIDDGTALRPLEGVRVLLIERHGRSREVWSQALSAAGAEVRAQPSWAAPPDAPSIDHGFDVAVLGGTDDGPAAPRPQSVRRLVRIQQGVSVDEGGGTVEGDDVVLSRPLLPSTLIAAVCRALVSQPVAQVPPRAPAAGAEGLAGRRILLVEDNQYNSEVASDLLAEVAGAVVIGVSSGADAVRAVQSQNFDAILLDLQIPDMDGFETAQRIRASEAASGDRRLPIIAMTAHVFADDLQRCRDTGMDDFIAKPFDPDELFATLARHVSRAQPGAGLLPPHDDLRQASGLPPLPPSGVDVELGLRRCVGRAALYERIARRFVAAARGDVARMAAMLQGGDADGLRTLAHSMASTAGTLGAERLARFARQLEDAILDGAPAAALSVPVNRVDTEHAEVLRALGSYLDSLPAQPGASA